MLKNKKIIILAIISAIIGLAALIFFASSPPDADRIYTHIYIHGIAVGGMSKEEAEAALMSRFQPGLEARTIQYKVGGETAAEFTFADFDARFDFTEPIGAALEYGSLRQFSMRVARLLGRPHEIETMPGVVFSAEKMEDAMRELSKLDTPPQNAYMLLENGEFTVKPSGAGRGIDITAAAEATREILNSLNDGSVDLHIITIAPLFTEKDFDFPKTLLGYFETEYFEDDGPRIRNVRRAAGRINNQTLYPGEVFSAGAKIGANSPESGYETAIVLVRGEPVEDVGGGVCQVVTTLYNAVLFAELQIIQRHNHSAGVSYVDMGFDATVAGNYYDLKFKNNMTRPVLITSRVENGLLFVGIYGYETRDPGRSLRFVARRVETIPPEPHREIIDPAVPAGERFVIIEALPGERVELYKYVYMHGQRVDREQVNTSVYKPLQGVIAIGAG